MDEIVLAGANIELDGNGHLERLLEAHRHIGPADAVFRQECRHVTGDGTPFLHAAAKVLGMRPVLAPGADGTNKPGLLTSSFFRPVKGRDNLLPFPFDKPPASGAFHIPGADRQIIMGSFHASYCSTTRRKIHAEELTRFADRIQDKSLSDGSRRKGSAVWLQMNANSYPVPIGDPDPVITDREIADRPHAVHRMRYNSATDQYEADTYLDRTLLRAGLHDPARYAFHVLGQREALRPTAGGRDGGQGGVRRIDRFYLDAWSVQAVTRVEVVDLSRFSDHHVIRVILSVPLLRAALRRDFPPLPPYPVSLDYTGIRSITSFVKSR